MPGFSAMPDHPIYHTHTKINMRLEGVHKQVQWTFHICILTIGLEQACDLGACGGSN